MTFINKKNRKKKRKNDFPLPVTRAKEVGEIPELFKTNEHRAIQIDHNNVGYLFIINSKPRKLHGFSTFKTKASIDIDDTIQEKDILKLIHKLLTE